MIVYINKSKITSKHLQSDNKYLSYNACNSKQNLYSEK